MLFGRHVARVRRGVPDHVNASAGTPEGVGDGCDLTACRWDLASAKETGRIDFGVIGDCPRCLATLAADRFVVGTSSWMLFEFEMKNQK